MYWLLGLLGTHQFGINNVDFNPRHTAVFGELLVRLSYARLANALAPGDRWFRRRSWFNREEVFTNSIRNRGFKRFSKGNDRVLVRRGQRGGC